MTRPQVELLFWDGCPSHPQALEELARRWPASGSTRTPSSCREVDTTARAEGERFVGSPDDPRRRRGRRSRRAATSRSG
jgi:hypothetical protein